MARRPAPKPAKGRGKTPSKTPRMQPGRNGGQLRVGGTNAGGPGRPTSAVRERCLGSFAERLPVLEQIIDNPDSAATDRIRAMDLLGKYGGLQTQQLDVTSGGQRFTLAIGDPPDPHAVPAPRLSKSALIGVEEIARNGTGKHHG
jgi:hypothetical protein